MDRSIQKFGLVNFAALLVVGVAGFTAARIAGSLAGQVCAVYLGLGTLVAAVSWFQTRLKENELEEKFEYDELLKSKSGSALFENREGEAFRAQRARVQFERFFVPAFTLLLFLAQAAGTFFLWRWIASNAALAGVQRPVVAIALFGLFFLVLFILGRFSAAMARTESCRLLRPAAGWLLLGAYLSLAVAIGLVAVWAGVPRADLYAARVLTALLGLMALETSITLLLEIYRPRVKGKVERPLYESRLVGLLGQPEGLITTAAQALDYQFGFKVSETWFFRLLQRHLAMLVTAQLLILLLSTCVVFIEPGEQGILERLGKPAGKRPVLAPGLHWKFPWPVDQVYRFHTEQIQSFNIGFKEDQHAHDVRTIVWTVPHLEEDNFLVASRVTETVDTGDPATVRRAPPVSLISVGIPVQYQITNVLHWAYHHEAPAELLQDVATREVVRYLVSVDLNEVMSRSRQAASEFLQHQIQTSANALHLGVRVCFVGIEGIHPPIKVAPEYEKVVGAEQTRRAKILTAEADAFRTNALAGAQAFSIVNDAQALRQSLQVGSLARAALFTNQIPAFAAAPSVYHQRVYFQTFAQAVAQPRKYVLLTTNTEEVIQFDLQDKIREDLLNLNVNTPKK